MRGVTFLNLHRQNLALSAAVIEGNCRKGLGKKSLYLAPPPNHRLRDIMQDRQEAGEGKDASATSPAEFNLLMKRKMCNKELRRRLGNARHYKNSQKIPKLREEVKERQRAIRRKGKRRRRRRRRRG